MWEHPWEPLGELLKPLQQQPQSLLPWHGSTIHSGPQRESGGQGKAGLVLHSCPPDTEVTLKDKKIICPKVCAHPGWLQIPLLAPTSQSVSCWVI